MRIVTCIVLGCDSCVLLPLPKRGNFLALLAPAVRALDDVVGSLWALCLLQMPPVKCGPIHLPRGDIEVWKYSLRRVFMGKFFFFLGGSSIQHV